MNQDDNLLTRKRYLRRTWKLFKPHLPRSDSLPDLTLIPHDHPLFTCETCNFANPLVELCFWCPPTTSSSISKDKIGFRYRRVSAPSLLLCWQPPREWPRSQTLPFTQTPVSSLRLSRIRQRLESGGQLKSSTFNGITRAPSNRLLVALPPAKEGDPVDNINPSECPCPCVVTATLSPLSPSIPLCRLDEGTYHRYLSSVTHVQRDDTDSDFFSNTNRCVDRGLTKDTKNTNTNMNHGAYRPSSTESSPAFAQSQLQSSESLLKCTSSSSSSHPIPSTPPLRRKKSHFVLHMSAPPQTKTHPSAPSQDIRQRHQSQPALHSDEGFTSAQSLRVPITDIRRPRHAYSRSEPPQHPLGHPNRPYYTALRKGMSPGSFSSSSMPPVDIFSTPSAAAPPLHSSTLSSVSSSPSRAPSPSLTSSSAFCYPYPYPYPYSYPNYPPTSFSDDTHGHSTALDDGSLAGSNPFEFGLGLRSWPSPPSLPASSADEPTTIIFSAISPEKRRKSGSVDLSSFKLKTKFSLRRHNLVSSVSSTSTSPSLLTSTSMITPITPLSPPTSPPTVFSKSDETMIRLALAREVRSHHARGGGIGNENGMVNDDEVLARADAEKFVYHGREKSMSMSMMKMKMRVKRLSRELKEIFGVWAW